MNLTKRPRSPFWWADVTVDGERHRFSTKRKSKEEAAQVVASFVKSKRDAAQLGVKAEMTLGEALQRHLLETKMAADWRMTLSRSRKLIGGALDEAWARLFKVKLEENPFEGRFAIDPARLMHEITPSVVSKLRAARMAEGNKPGTVNREVALLQTVYNKARQEWEVRVTPDVVFKKDRENRKLRWLTPEEVDALLRELDPDRHVKGMAPVGKRHPLVQRKLQDQYDLVVVLLDTGARYSEIATLSWDVVDTAEWKTINVYRSKVGNEGTLAMTARLREVLQRRREMRLNSPYVFPGYADNGEPRGHSTRGIMKAMERAGINTPDKVRRLGKATVHTLRDTFASWLVMADVSLYKVQKLLGHKSAAMTEKYAHLAPDQVAHEAAQVLDRLAAANYPVPATKSARHTVSRDVAQS